MLKFLRKILIGVVFTGIFCSHPVFAEDQNNFEHKFTFTVSVSRNSGGGGQNTNTNYNRSYTYFKISAKGTFFIDWGDGTTETVTRTSTTQYSCSHRYTSTGTKTVHLGGLATEYSTGTAESDSSILFADDTYITGISGSLGAIFPTLSDGSQPLFRATFADCTKLEGSIPSELFTGITGQPRDYMFQSLFYGCTALTGTIPETLFSGLYGTPTTALFRTLFYNCNKLSGEIPGGLFSGISGNPTTELFQSTFNRCSRLSGFIPPELFENISKTTTATDMMSSIFYNSGLDTSCPTGYEQYITGFESYFNNKVSCIPESACPTGYAEFNNTCYRLCSFATKLKTSTGLSYNLFGEQESSGNPSLHIQSGNTMCYVYLEPGSGDLNVSYSGNTYHCVGE